MKSKMSSKAKSRTSKVSTPIKIDGSKCKQIRRTNDEIALGLSIPEVAKRRQLIK